MDPSAAPAVPVSWEVVSWVLAAVAAAGTITLAAVGIGQSNREKQRQEREDTPMLLLAGVQDQKRKGGYRIDLANLSPKAIWIDGVYADWKTEGDGRLTLGPSDPLLEFEDSEPMFRFMLKRTPVKPSDWVWLREPFSPDAAGGGSESGDALHAEAEIVAAFHYAPTGARLHLRAWRIRGQGHQLEVEDIKVPAWFSERRRGG